MKLISHRGLISGPDKSKENSPEQVMLALKSGYDCEIDLWFVNYEPFLGHDEPQYRVTDAFLNNKGLWIHAKNLESLEWLTTTKINYFWHQDDDFTMTSHGFIWTYPGKPIGLRSVCVMPEKQNDWKNNLNFNCIGICSDFVQEIQDIYRTQQF